MENFEYLSNLRERVGERVRSVMKEKGYTVRSFVRENYQKLGYKSPLSAQTYIAHVRVGRRTIHPLVDSRRGRHFTKKEKSRLIQLLNILNVQDNLLEEVNKLEDKNDWGRYGFARRRQ